MSERKSYGQFCGLARALDHVGDRWTLLVVRELLLGDRTFRQLEQALPGISPSLLNKRLNDLAADCLIERNAAPQRSKSVLYRLTDAGRSLDRVILELIRWGSTWMADGPGNDRVDARWAPLALRALLEDQRADRGSRRVHLDADGTPVTVASHGTRRRVTVGHQGRADVTVSAPLPILLAIAAGMQPLRNSGAIVSGDAAIAEALLTPA